jgi:hypothetical protein
MGWSKLPLVLLLPGVTLPIALIQTHCQCSQEALCTFPSGLNHVLLGVTIISICGFVLLLDCKTIELTHLISPPHYGNKNLCENSYPWP